MRVIAQTCQGADCPLRIIRSKTSSHRSRIGGAGADRANREAKRKLERRAVRRRSHEGSTSAAEASRGLAQLALAFIPKRRHGLASRPLPATCPGLRQRRRPHSIRATPSGTIRLTCPPGRAYPLRLLMFAVTPTHAPRWPSCSFPANSSVHLALASIVKNAPKSLRCLKS